jgi:hypothetical protein
VKAIPASCSRLYRIAHIGRFSNALSNICAECHAPRVYTVERRQIGISLRSAIHTHAAIARETARLPVFWKDYIMYKALSGAIVAFGLAGAALAISGPASADGVGVHVGGVGIGVNLDNVAFGYQDGYWDHGHQWHQWRNDQEMRDYRSTPGNKYNDYRHDRDHDMGWHQ